MQISTGLLNRIIGVHSLHQCSSVSGNKDRTRGLGLTQTYRSRLPISWWRHSWAHLSPFFPVFADAITPENKLCVASRSQRADGKLISGGQRCVHSSPKWKSWNFYCCFCGHSTFIELVVQYNLWTPNNEVGIQHTGDLEKGMKACAEGGDKWEAKSYQDVLFHNVIKARFKIP